MIVLRCLFLMATTENMRTVSVAQENTPKNQLSSGKHFPSETEGQSSIPDIFADAWLPSRERVHIPYQPAFLSR